MINKTFVITLFIWMSSSMLTYASELEKSNIPNKPSKVELKQTTDGKWQLFVNDRLTPIRGAGGVLQKGMLEQFSKMGGNFTRTWGIDSLEDDVGGGERYIDKAYRLGVHVMPGIWLEHERHDFDYRNQEMLEKQRQKVREAVRKYKDHPAVVMWGLGNEMEDPVSQTGKPEIWRELEVLAKIIKEEDPHHPVCTVIAGAAKGKIEGVMTHAPSIDVLGVNAYGSAGGVGEALKRGGWKKPFTITEFGVKGFWEVPTTSWGAPIEPSSQEKARSYYAMHKLVCDINEGKELCLGTFAFLWGWKQEKTSTWFGMVLPSMEKLPQVDAMVKAWTGQWPNNRCPKISKVEASFFGQEIQPNQPLQASVEVSDPDGDALSYEWLVMEESKVKSVGGDKEPVPPAHPALTQHNNSEVCDFKSPQERGAYRLFLTIKDGRGSAATANIPFFVR